VRLYFGFCYMLKIEQGIAQNLYTGALFLARWLPRKQVYSYTCVRDIFASNLGMVSSYDVKRSSCFYYDFRECRYGTTKHGPNFFAPSFSYLLFKTTFSLSSSNLLLSFCLRVLDSVPSTACGGFRSDECHDYSWRINRFFLEAHLNIFHVVAKYRAIEN